MIRFWVKLLPYFIATWMIRRFACRLEAVPGYYSASPFKGEVYSWKKSD